MFNGPRALVVLDNEYWWRPLVPLAGLGLIAFILASYAVAIRSVAVARWCAVVPLPAADDDDAETEDSSGRFLHSFFWLPPSSCQVWMPLNDLAVTYFGTMILFHYICTVFRSPGVVVAAAARHKKDQTRMHQKPNYCHPSHNNDDAEGRELKFSAWKSQGGLLCCDTITDLEAEERRVQLYGPLPDRPIFRKDDNNNNNRPLPNAPPSSNNNNNNGKTAVVLYVPSPDPSYCEICQHARPPRSHHCSTCHRCILQYDHHCIWVNQCIGYNNLGHFLGMVWFLVAGCLYGAVLLWLLHYRTAWQQLLLLNDNREGGGTTRSLAMEAVRKMVRCELVLQLVFRDGGPVPPETYMNLVFPILVGIELMLAWMGGGHAVRLCRATTTLESKLVRQQLRLNRKHNTSVKHHQQQQHEVAVVNPFDQGIARNVFQVLGPRPLLWFLPVLQSPVPPFLPPSFADKGR